MFNFVDLSVCQVDDPLRVFSSQGIMRDHHDRHTLFVQAP